MSLQVLTELKRILKEDADVELNIHKTSVLPKGLSHQTVFDVTQNIYWIGAVLVKGCRLQCRLERVVDSFALKPEHVVCF